MDNLKFNLIVIDDNRRRIIYKIDQDYIMINNKKFKCRKNTSNLSKYLNENDYSIIKILNNSIHNKCINCNNIVTNNRFERNKFFTYKFCDRCDNENIRKKHDIINCIICDKPIKRKDIVYSTCGNNKCLDEYRKRINNNIKKTHWTLSEDKERITNNRIKSRKENDIKYDRNYIPWNKGKTNIYSKETIEKIRNATIKQMKEGRIKKTSIEKKIENFLLNNDIKYKYSFIYERRQYDFLLLDYNIIIEVNGDYWHANPKFWDVNNDSLNKKQLYETQKMKIKDDIIKKRIIDNSKYELLIIWEDDINNNFNYIENTILEKINNYNG